MRTRRLLEIPEYQSKTIKQQQRSKNGNDTERHENEKKEG